MIYGVAVTDDENMADPDASDTPEEVSGDEATGSPGVCALDGCDNPLPPRSTTSDGRRRSGRPAAYCCKGHADAASRARRSAQTAAIVDPLVEAQRLAELFDPAAQALAATLGEMRERLARAETGALGRVRAAESEAAEARQDAEAAERAAQAADAARVKVVATARDDRQSRQVAERNAERAERAAEDVRRRSWEQVAQHERARGAAEAAQAAAQRSRDELALEVRALRSDYSELLSVHRAAQRDLADRDTALARADATRASMAAQLEAAEEGLAKLRNDHDTARQELHGARGELHAVRVEVDGLREEARQLRERSVAEHTARRLAESHASTLDKELAGVREELTATHARFDRLLTSRDPADPQSGEDSQGEDPTT
jgi:chromosome segregation ATPase